VYKLSVLYHILVRIIIVIFINTTLTTVYFIKLYLYTGRSWRCESYLDSKYTLYSVETYRFCKKPIAEKLVSVQIVNAKCGGHPRRRRMKVEPG